MTRAALRWARRKLGPPTSQEEARRRKVAMPSSPSHEEVMEWWEREKLARHLAHVTQTTTQ